MKKMFNNSLEIMLAITEEVGELAQEVALMEKIGSKKDWNKLGSKDRIWEEASHVENLIIELKNMYR